ncbi:hypothetical protein MAH1_20890 [Sessilibacter sp. MAH1]
MNITPKPIPAQKLPPPSGTDPVYLQSLIDKAVEQLLLAQGVDGELPYWDYIDKCKFRLAAVLA